MPPVTIEIRNKETTLHVRVRRVCVSASGPATSRGERESMRGLLPCTLLHLRQSVLSCLTAGARGEPLPSSSPLLTGPASQLLLSAQLCREGFNAAPGPSSMHHCCFSFPHFFLRVSSFPHRPIAVKPFPILLFSGGERVKKQSRPIPVAAAVNAFYCARTPVAVSTTSPPQAQRPFSFCWK